MIWSRTCPFSLNDLRSWPCDGTRWCKPMAGIMPPECIKCSGSPCLINYVSMWHLVCASLSLNLPDKVQKMSNGACWLGYFKVWSFRGTSWVAGPCYHGISVHSWCGNWTHRQTVNKLQFHISWDTLQMLEKAKCNF